MKKNIIVFCLMVFISLLSIIIISKFIKNDFKVKNNKEENNAKIDNYKENSQEDEGETDMYINIIIENKSFIAKLEANETSKEFIDMLPLEINMSELHENEKYFYLDEKLTTNAYIPKRINKGDIMLFGSECLVLFYKSFETSYSYTKIGSIINPVGLDEALGNSNVTVRFELNDDNTRSNV